MSLIMKDKSAWYKFHKDEKKRGLPQLSISQSLADADLMWQSAYEVSINNGIDWVSLHKDVAKDQRLKEQLNFAHVMSQARYYLKR